MTLQHTEIAKKFYNSAKWRKLRKWYIEQPEITGLCERCLSSGRYEAGIILDHIIEINIDNINNPDITLNPDNLQFLCLFHHNRKTFTNADKEPTVTDGYYFDKHGQFVPIDCNK